MLKIKCLKSGLEIELVTQLVICANVQFPNSMFMWLVIRNLQSHDLLKRELRHFSKHSDKNVKDTPNLYKCIDFFLVQCTVDRGFTLGYAC